LHIPNDLKSFNNLKKKKVKKRKRKKKRKKKRENGIPGHIHVV